MSQDEACSCSAPFCPECGFYDPVPRPAPTRMVHISPPGRELFMAWGATNHPPRAPEGDVMEKTTTEIQVLEREELEKLSTDELSVLGMILNGYRDEVSRVLRTRGGLFLYGYASDKKIHVVKLVREITGLGLREAKLLVEEPLPVCIRAGKEWAEDPRLKAAAEELETVAKVAWFDPVEQQRSRP